MGFVGVFVHQMMQSFVLTMTSATHTGWLIGITPIWSVSAVLFLGVGCSGLGYLLWYAALDRVETARVASLLHVEPLIAFAAAAILLGERVTHAVIVGVVMVLAGVMVLQKAKSSEVKELKS